MRAWKLLFPVTAVIFLFLGSISSSFGQFDNDRFEIPLLDPPAVEEPIGFGGGFEVPEFGTPRAEQNAASQGNFQAGSAFTQDIPGGNGNTVASNPQNPVVPPAPQFQNQPETPGMSRGLPEDLRPPRPETPTLAPPRRQDVGNREGAAQLPPPADQLDDIYNRPYNSQATVANRSDEIIRSLEDARHPFYGLLVAPNEPGTQIQGTPITLSEVLAKTQSPAIRCELITKYWEMSGALVVYNHRSEQLKVLSPIQNNSAQTEAAFRLAYQKKRIAELQFLRKQFELAALLKQNGVYTDNEVVGLPQAAPGEKLPFPCDYPLMNPYKTKASELIQVGYRPLSQKAILLDKTLPLDFLSLDAHKEAVLAANQLEAASRSNVDVFVMAVDKATEAKIDYANAIIEYNSRIADYVAETVGPEVQGRRLLTTIILLPKEAGTEIARPEISRPNPTGSGQLANRPQPHNAPAHQANVWQELSDKGQVRAVGADGFNGADERESIIPAIPREDDIRERYNNSNPIRNAGADDRQNSMIPRERDEPQIGPRNDQPTDPLNDRLNEPVGGFGNESAGPPFQPNEITPREDFFLPDF